MAKRKPKLTPNQLEYQKQLKNLQRRIKSWQRKGYEFDVNIPSKPERITKKDIQKLKNIQFKRFSKEEKQLAKYRHEEIEERNKIAQRIQIAAAMKKEQELKEAAKQARMERK